MTASESPYLPKCKGSAQLGGISVLARAGEVGGKVGHLVQPLLHHCKRSGSTKTIKVWVATACSVSQQKKSSHLSLAVIFQAEIKKR